MKHFTPFAESMPITASWFRFNAGFACGFTSTAQNSPPRTQKKSGQPRFVSVHPSAVMAS